MIGKSLLDAIKALVDYNLRDELNHFCEESELDITQFSSNTDNDEIELWIQTIEDNGWTTHILYDLLLIKYHLEI